MTLEIILSTLDANLPELRRLGFESLVLIDPQAALAAGHPLHFLADFTPPRDYARLNGLTAALSGLVAYPVELVLARADHAAVQPFLDPGAIVIL
jgi:hypothetical protein